MKLTTIDDARNVITRLDMDCVVHLQRYNAAIDKRKEERRRKTKKKKRSGRRAVMAFESRVREIINRTSIYVYYDSRIVTLSNLFFYFTVLCNDLCYFPLSFLRYLL